MTVLWYQFLKLIESTVQGRGLSPIFPPPFFQLPPWIHAGPSALVARKGLTPPVLVSRSSFLLVPGMAGGEVSLGE